MKSKDSDDPVVRILVLCKLGASKEDIATKLSLSGQQLRRHTAELVDRGLLHLDPDKRILVTTERGIIFLNSHSI